MHNPFKIAFELCYLFNSFSCKQKKNNKKKKREMTKNLLSPFKNILQFLIKVTRTFATKMSR